MGHEHEAILVFGPSGWPTAYTWMFDLVDGPGWYANDLEPGFHKGPRLKGPVRWMWLVQHTPPVFDHVHAAVGAAVEKAKDFTTSFNRKDKLEDLSHAVSLAVAKLSMFVWATRQIEQGASLMPATGLITHVNAQPLPAPIPVAAGDTIHAEVADEWNPPERGGPAWDDPIRSAPPSEAGRQFIHWTPEGEFRPSVEELADLRRVLSEGVVESAYPGIAATGPIDISDELEPAPARVRFTAEEVAHWKLVSMRTDDPNVDLRDVISEGRFVPMVDAREAVDPTTGEETYLRMALTPPELVYGTGIRVVFEATSQAYAVRVFDGGEEVFSQIHTHTGRGVWVSDLNALDRDTKLKALEERTSARFCEAIEDWRADDAASALSQIE